ncbi:MAG TPA: transposase [Anaerolineae bacterium]|nr:transposase [Anaerolineae bacterium]
MAIVPDFVLTLVNAHLEPLLDWFSDRLYLEFLRHAADHLLVQLHARLDCRPLEQACAAFHHRRGPGTRPTHAVSRLVRALLVKALFDWSLREVEWHIRFNLIVKWFVGYRIFDAGPDHVTLERFEHWVTEHQHRTFFDEVLHKIDRDFPQEREQPQVGDTFAMRADAAKESLIRLIRHTCARMLAEFELAAADRHQRLSSQLDRVALFGPAHEVNELRLDATGRQARLQTTVRAALECARLMRAELDTPPPLAEAARAAIQARLADLDKILADNVRLTRDADGQVARVTEWPKDKKGAYRLGSATDPEATYRVHGEKKTDFGYNVSVAATEHFVREIQAATGAQPDPVAIPDLLTAQIEQHDLCPDKFIYDAAGSGKTHALVSQATEGQTQLVAPLLPYDKRTERFTPDDFVLSDDGRALTCPNGQTSTTAYRSGSGDGRSFRFFGCERCPLAERCRDPKSDPDQMRQVFISDYRDDLNAARAYAQTEDFKLDMQRRPGIERVIACLTRYHGARRARRRGLRQADFQAKLSAMAFNLKQWMKLLCHAQVVRC